jgi:hypothetical protein
MSQIKVDSIVPRDGVPSGADGGGIIQIKRVASGSEVTSTNNVPRDSSVPLSTEGVELLSTSFSCQSTSNKVFITVCVYGNEDSNLGDNLTFCVYDGSTFIGMGHAHVTGGGIENYNNTTFNVLYSPSSTSSKTYSVRGAVEAGTFESLGTTVYAVNSHYNSQRKNTMTIYEISA